VQLEENGDMASLQERYIDPPNPVCKRDGVSDQSTKIGMEEVAGLWILLAAGIGIACLLVVGLKLHERYAAKHLKTLGTKMQRSVSRTFGRASVAGGKSKSGNAVVDVEVGKGVEGGQESGSSDDVQ